MEAVTPVDPFETVSLNQLLEEMIPDAEYEAQQRESTVVLKAECECAVQGKEELLYRAIENVVRNAIRYTEPGSAVEIRLYTVEENQGRTAVVEISDRGPGIPEAELQAIFRPFYRVDRARSTQTGGFGVGLAIADRAVKLHNGQLKASNRDGGGATIQMRFRNILSD
jgi:two-component system sensor histidine kinase CpxA